MKLRKRLFQVLALAGLCAMIFFSAQNAEASDAVSLGLIDRFLSWIHLPTGSLNHIVRKCAHATLFMAEGFCVRMALDSSPISWGICAVLAVFNELQQVFADGRSCEVRDMCIDAGGALIGVLIAAGLLALLNRHHKEKKS